MGKFKNLAANLLKTQSVEKEKEGMPNPEQYGWSSTCTFEPQSGWKYEGGEEAFIFALREWEDNREDAIKPNIRQLAIDWWNSLPMQDLKECKLGWANLVMKYFPHKTDCQDVSITEILSMYICENLESTAHIDSKRVDTVKKEAGIELLEWIAVNYVPVTCNNKLEHWKCGSYQSKKVYTTKQVYEEFLNREVK